LVLAAGLLLSAGLGCAADPGDGAADVELKTSALNGTTLFDPTCDDAARSKIIAGMSIIQPQVKVTPAPLTACLADAVLSSAGPGYAEKIMADVGTNHGSFFKCTTAAEFNGNALGLITVNGQTVEGVNLEPGFVHNSAASVVGGTMIHEISHDYNYGHQLGIGGDLATTVPDQIERCSSSIADPPTGGPGPNGTARSKIPTETELGPVGQNGGTPSKVTCADDSAVFGIVVRTGGNVDQLALACRSQTQLGGPTPPRIVTLSAVGGTGGTLASQACNSDEVAIGATGRASNVLNSIGLVCAATGAVTSGGAVPRPLTPIGSPTNGTPWTRICPNGMALRGIVARSGSAVDRVRLLCRQISQLNVFSEVEMVPFGNLDSNASPVEEIHHCPGASTMMGFRGIFTSNSEVNRLQPECQQVGITCSDATHCQFGAGLLATNFDMPGEGGFQGDLPIDDCGFSGLLSVGVNFRSGARIDQIHGLCADPAQWLANNTNPVTITTAQGGGGPGGLPGDRMCPRGSVLAGWKIGTVSGDNKTYPQFNIFEDGRRVSKLTLLCRAPGPTPPIAQIPVPGPSIPSLAVVGVTGVSINDRVKVLNADGTLQAPVANLGAGTVGLGVSAQTASVWSARDVVLRSNAQVFGFVDAAVGPLSTQGAFYVKWAVVTGPGATFTIPPLPTAPQFPSGTFTNLNASPGMALGLIAPGNWGALTLPQGASVSLRAGTYNFTSIDMEPGSQMTLDKTLGAVRVVVRDSIIFRGNFVDGGGAAGNNLFEYLGPDGIPVDTPFLGTLYAPRGSIAVNTVSTPHKGAFIGNFVTLHQDTTLLFTPFPGTI